MFQGTKKKKNVCKLCSTACLPRTRPFRQVYLNVSLNVFCLSLRACLCLCSRISVCFGLYRVRLFLWIGAWNTSELLLIPIYLESRTCSTDDARVAINLPPKPTIKLYTCESPSASSLDVSKAPSSLRIPPPVSKLPLRTAGDPNVCLIACARVRVLLLDILDDNPEQIPPYSKQAPPTKMK